MKRIFIIIAVIIVGLIIWLFMKPSPFCPCKEKLQEIEKRVYVDNEYTCLHKSRDYCKFLNDAGYTARIVVGPVTWDKRDHAWVEIIHENRTYWVDPTTKSGCWESTHFKDRKVVSSSYESKY